jgi:hypothetical protein
LPVIHGKTRTTSKRCLRLAGPSLKNSSDQLADE